MNLPATPLKQALFAVIAVAWLAIFVAACSIGRHVKEEYLIRFKRERRRLDPIFVAPEALTPTGLKYRRIVLVAGTAFLAAALLMALLPNK